MIVLGTMISHAYSVHGRNLTGVTSALDTLVPVWIVAFVYGGGCGLYACFQNSVVAVMQTLACWMLSCLFHMWFLFVVMTQKGQDARLVSSIASVSFQMIVDLVNGWFVFVFLMVMRSHRTCQELVLKEEEAKPILSAKRSDVLV